MAIDPLTVIKQFVAGDITPQEFRDHLYECTDFEAILENDPHLPANTYVGTSVYQFLINEDLDSPGGVLSAHGALVQFLDRNGHSYTQTAKYETAYTLLLKAQPPWLDVSDTWLAEHVLPDAGDRSGAALQEWLSNELLRLFRYVDAPPQWVQSPQWPINENGPLVFLGQFEVSHYFHDVATVYVFHDPKIGICQTVIQVD